MFLFWLNATTQELCSVTHAERFQMTNRIMHCETETLEVELFLSSWSSTALGVGFDVNHQIDTYDLAMEISHARK